MAPGFLEYGVRLWMARPRGRSFQNLAFLFVFVSLSYFLVFVLVVYLCVVYLCLSGHVFVLWRVLCVLYLSWWSGCRWPM